jgi:hypothetical protein
MMKNIIDVLKQKESQLQQVQKEIEALQLTMSLLTEDTAHVEPAGPRLGTTGALADSRLKEATSGVPHPKHFP